MIQPREEWVLADFNGAFHDLLCLSHGDAVTDLSGREITLRAGMLLTACDEDVDEDGNPDWLLATGIVELACPRIWSGRCESSWPHLRASSLFERSENGLLARSREFRRGCIAERTVRSAFVVLHAPVLCHHLVTLEPRDSGSLRVGDIVLVRVRGTDYLHLIKAIDDGRFQIGNNRGGINGWVRDGAIYGIATKVESGSA